MQTDFDAIVIGAGSGGLTSSIGLTKVGKRVLLIEKEYMGGDCTNFGCIPSKRLIHHAQEYHLARTKAGETAELEKFKSRILKSVRDMVLEIRHEESPEKLEKHYKGLTVIKGEAKFQDKCTVKVGNKKYTAKRFIIATGSSPRTIKIPGLTPNQTLTNKNIFDLKKFPEDLVIVGGGAIASEMAEAFALLGTKVTVVVRSQLLRKEEPEIAAQAKKNFETLGITVLEESSVEKCEKG